MALTLWCRAMTTPAARSRSTAILSPRPRSTAFRARSAISASMWVPPKPRSPRRFRPMPGPRGVADDLKKLPGVSGPVEKQLNDLGVFHYSQLAELGPADAEKIGEEVGLPTRV